MPFTMKKIDTPSRVLPSRVFRAKLDEYSNRHNIKPFTAQSQNSLYYLHLNTIGDNIADLTDDTIAKLHREWTEVTYEDPRFEALAKHFVRDNQFVRQVNAVRFLVKYEKGDSWYVQND